MKDFSFSVFPNENFLDLRLFQYGWEQCAPLHSFGPFVRNNFLLHYVISGRGQLDATGPDGVNRRYVLGPDQGFLICPGLVNTYFADKKDPWKYVWLEFGGLRAEESLGAAGLGPLQPIYQPGTPDQGRLVRDAMLYIAAHSQASTLHLIGHLYLFLDGLIQSSSTRREAAGPRLQDFYIQEAVTFMEHNYQRELTVEEIADMCKLNRSYFSKMFRDSMGCPPQEFLIRLRLPKPAPLLPGVQKAVRRVPPGVADAEQGPAGALSRFRAGLPPRGKPFFITPPPDRAASPGSPPWAWAGGSLRPSAHRRAMPPRRSPGIGPAGPAP